MGTRFPAPPCWVATAILICSNCSPVMAMMSTSWRVMIRCPCTRLSPRPWKRAIRKSARIKKRLARMASHRSLKWVLLVTVPRTVLDATASVLTRSANDAGASTDCVGQAERKALRTASVRQDHRQYLEMGLANATASVLTRSANDAGASTDCVGQAERKALRTASVRQDQRKY